MKFHSIRWRLPFSYALIALLAAFSLGLVMYLVLSSHYTGLERDYLMGNAESLQPMVEELLQSNSPIQILQNQINGLAFISQTRIRVLDQAGNSIADSGTSKVNQLVTFLSMPVDQLTDVPFVDTGTNLNTSVFLINSAETLPAQETGAAIWGGGMASQTDYVISVSAEPLGGFGFTSEAVMMEEQPEVQRSSQVVSLPLKGALGTLEVSNGPAYGADILQSVMIAWAGASLVALFLAACVGWYISNTVTRPVLALTEAAHHMEQGDLGARVVMAKEKQQEFLSLAHAFNDMAGQVEKTVLTLREFVSDAAHEINTPLTALKTNLELAVNAPETASREIYLQRAIEQNQRLERLAGSLLDLSRIEAGKADQLFEKLDLRQMAAETSERFASRAEQAERNFILTLPEAPVWISGNALQIQRVLDNLLENALKFTPPGGTITLSLAAEKEAAVLSVSDTGIGIPPEDLPHLFERFHRAHNAAAYPGNGLGLAIVKAVADVHDGTLQAESKPDEGTRISLRLPLEKSE